MRARCTLCNGHVYFRDHTGAKLSDQRCACTGRYERLSHVDKIPIDGKWIYRNAKGQQFVLTPNGYLMLNPIA